jgi:hypothetical protein
VLIQEEDGVQRLILRGRADLGADRQCAQERRDVSGAEAARMSSAVEDDEAPDPVHVGVFGAAPSRMQILPR